ncbi:5951_t:CDS:2 [Ambispora gerdemannii]|uniref:5951_t:CDS:1 n=1 Tax=Ambispora gerdemannii TaxID=144530 RepID=A0A9N8V0J6_9GLOM|nr:5951_t:CDS:2 [Ambispora gerdemannii]
MDIEHGREEERQKKLKDAEDRKKRDDALQKALHDKNIFNPEGKGTIITAKNVHHLGIRNTNGANFECNSEQCHINPSAPTLIFSEKINTYIHNVLYDMTLGHEFSDKPYIVFIEEADQGINALGKSGRADEKNKGLLEEYKNFLSKSTDQEGLKGDAQDLNSIIIIATNNFESIDPAVFRRGRLGEKLNFN